MRGGEEKEGRGDEGPHRALVWAPRMVNPALMVEQNIKIRIPLVGIDFCRRTPLLAL